MRKIKSTYVKALAILLSMAMLITGLPQPIYAKSVATSTDIEVDQPADEHLKRSSTMQ